MGIRLFINLSKRVIMYFKEGKEDDDPKNSFWFKGKELKGK